MTTPFEILKKHPVHASIKALLQDNEEKTKEIERTRHVENVLIAENGRLHAEIEKLKAAPTQAQIEAAANSLHRFEVEHGYISSETALASDETYLAMAKAALTAAAGYGEPQGTGFQAGEAEPAAAEVGPKSQELHDAIKRDLVAAVEAATIERCAQVAKDFYNQANKSKQSAFGDALYAAIRALKD